ncbi:MAG: nucleotidyltransferase domain-containing protein [Candidatus Zixiibacteriota bacterium]
MVKDKKIEKIIGEIVERIRKEYQPEKIILFGSYAYGEPHEESDIDLFIIKDTDKRRIDRFVEVKKLVYGPNRKNSVSPLIYTNQELQERLKIKDFFVCEILEKGRVLYG